MPHKQNSTEDIVEFGGDIDSTKADQILEEWARLYPAPRNPLFNLKLLPYLPVNKAWILLIAGPAGERAGLWRDLDATQPLPVAEVIKQSGRFIDNWRSRLKAGA